MIKNNFIKNNFLIILFFIFIFIFQFYSFQDITPHHDQTFHINWLLNLKNSDHFLTSEFFTNFKSLKYDNNGFIHELLKPANNPVDYHAYLFQINSILVVYFFSLFIKIEPIQLYILVSVFFSSLSIILNYKILIIILKKYEIYKSSYFNNFIYQLIFCLINVSFYRFFFSPLGHHNISYFFFSLTVFILINKNLNSSKTFPYVMGIVLGIVSYFQITIVLLLLPFISLFFLFYNLEINYKNFSNFLKFFSICLIFYIPFLVVIFNDLIYSNNSFFINLVGNESLEIEFYTKKVIFWFKKFYKFGFPIIFFSFFLSIIISIKLKKNNYIQFIILIHFLINIFLSIFYISYLRNFFYIYNIFLILGCLSLIYLYQKNNFYKIFVVFLILFNFFYNGKIILNAKNLENIEPLFYQLYFEDKGGVKNKIQKIISLEKENLVFFSDFSKNYFKIYQSNYVKNNFLTNRPLLNISNHLKNRDNTYSQNNLNNFNSLKENFYLISFSQDFNFVRDIVIKLQNENLIYEKCTIELPHLINEPIFRDSGSGDFNVNIFLTKISC